MTIFETEVTGDRQKEQNTYIAHIPFFVFFSIWVEFVILEEI